MNSSISSSEPSRGWRRFCATVLACTLAPSLLVYLFIVLVDPWGMLPLGLPIAREPISTNARYSFPALAKSDDFDAAVIGTSTSRLLAPAMLDPIFHARFANLAMNAATPWEQGRMLALFARHHPRARAVIIGLDQSWCLAGPDAPRLTGRSFPGWMYGGTSWRGYLAMFNLYALQEAANQFSAAIGVKKKHYGRDGYTNFLPHDAAYDPARVAAIFRSWGPPSVAPAAGPVTLPSIDDLPFLLGRLPASAVKLLVFPPLAIERTGAPGTAIAASWAACKQGAIEAARRTPNTLLLDFAIPGSITRSHGNFWDPLHYRVAIADRMVADIALARAGKPVPNDDARVLVGGPPPTATP